MIGITLKDFQERAVDFLFDKTNDTTAAPKITLQSPTGSGKTIILIAYLEQYLAHHTGDVVCWICPGKGELEEQSKAKTRQLTPHLKTGGIQDILTQGFKERTTYFINWETITKKDNTALRESERKNLYERIAEAHQQGRRFIVIIDEEHQHNTSKANDIINALNAKYEIRVSATPHKRVVGEFYEISELDVIDEELITRFMYINYDMEHVQSDSIHTETELLLRQADKIRQEILAAYEEEGEEVRPLVLVQFPNLNDALIEFVEEKLGEMGYTYENKMLASWFSAETKAEKALKSKKLGKINIGTTHEESITNHDATPAFLLFKQALATGWDCPRAKILVKLRENMSDTFEIQTLGRLRRMPKARHYGKAILDCSYLYTFDEKYKLDVMKASTGFETQRVFLKEEAREIQLKKESRHQDGNYIDVAEIRQKVYDYLKEKYHLGTNKADNYKKLEHHDFIFGTKIQTRYLTGKYATLSQIEEDRTHYQTREVEINLHDHGLDKRQCLDMLKKPIGLNYEKNHELMKTLFLRGFGNRRYKLLNLSLREFSTFIINNARRLLDDFRHFSAERHPETRLFGERRTESFTIPREEHYRYVPYEKDTRELVHNVYKGYNMAMITDDLRSTSERLFEKYCEQSPNVKFVYKNGDVGQQYLSIVYQTNAGVERLFYPDYIVQLRDDTIWLIETKGGERNGQDKNIDLQVENKFAALKNFANGYHYRFGMVRDRNDTLYVNRTNYAHDMQDDSWELLDDVF